MKSRILAIIGLSLLASSGFIAVVAAEQGDTRLTNNTIPATKSFVHPGALETQAAANRMKAKVAASSPGRAGGTSR